MAPEPSSPTGGDLPSRFAFPRRLRLSGLGAFDAVYAARACRRTGPLAIHARPNDLGHSRLGLALPRRVGTAAVRNRIKRLLRETFRHLHHDLPRGYDVVVQVRRHEPLPLAEYQRLLSRAWRGLHRDWLDRDASASSPAAGGTGSKPPPPSG